MSKLAQQMEAAIIAAPSSTQAAENCALLARVFSLETQINTLKNLSAVTPFKNFDDATLVSNRIDALEVELKETQAELEAQKIAD